MARFPGRPNSVRKCVQQLRVILGDNDSHNRVVIIPLRFAAQEMADVSRDAVLRFVE